MNHLLGHRWMLTLAVLLAATVPLPTSRATHATETVFLDASVPPKQVANDDGCTFEGCWWEFGLAEVNGEAITDSIMNEAPCYGGTQFIEYNLSRDWQGFQMTAGLDDGSEAEMEFIFETFVDGALRSTERIGLGEAVPITVDVTGALRLRLAITPVEEEGCDSITVFGGATVTRPQAHSHARSISLGLRRHVVAKGQVSVNDSFELCASNVSVEVRRKASRYDNWATVSTATTDEVGSFRTKLPDRKGSYRAVVQVTEFGTNWPEDVCEKAKSTIARHTH